MRARTDRTKVIYISGAPRSGSTVLAKTLGELDDSFSAGELRLIWKRSYLDNEPCGCGVPFADCPVWSTVTERAGTAFSDDQARWMVRHYPRLKNLPLLIAPGTTRLNARRFAPYVATLDRLYRSVAEATGSRVIIDSSKSPVYSYLLRLVPSIDVYIVHLIRDPRGTQYSWLRRHARGDARFSEHSVARSTLKWTMLNVIHELLGLGTRGHYLRVRYEDFISDPLPAITAIKQLIGEPELGAPTIADGNILLGTNHLVAGSENRGESGIIPLRMDDRWRSGLDAQARSTVTCLTFPLLHRYGYR